jgi:MFS family permease
MCGKILSVCIITEPKKLVVSQTDTIQEKVSFKMVLMNIKPLWGFIVYDIYAMGIQISGIKTDHYWAEIIAVIITFYFVIITLFAKESSTDNNICFRKVLAAHSFSWIGVQTMFVFIIAFLQDKMPSLSDDDLGKVIAMSFLILSAVSALLPAFVLEHVAKKIRRVKNHTYCIASMAVSYGLVSAFGDVKEVLYLLMALLGIGWSAIISLPFAIMSEKVKQSRMGLYMGLFNLSVVLPQLLVSLAIGLFISKVADKSLVFQISAVALAISALAWTKVQEHSKA